MKDKEKISPENLIVVVGDWVIDEYWMLVRHQSRISSHTGFVHYRIASDPDDRTFDLCGAGHVTRILSQSSKLQNGYQLVGIGNWHEEDTNYLLHLLHSRENPDCKAAKALFRQVRHYCKNPPGVILHTLSRFSATTRVIRLYHLDPTGVKQINRVDWELPRIAHDTDERRSIESLALPDVEGRVIIAVNDLRKGVVTKSLVDEIKKKYPEAAWCVRTKDPDKAKPYIERIPNLALYVVGPEVAARANPWDTWISNDRITQQALKTLESLPGKNAFLISHQHQIVARLEGDQCLIAQSTTEHDVTSQLGWSAAMFASIIEKIALFDEPIDATQFKDVIKKADREAGLPLTKKAIDVDDPIVRKTSWKSEKEDWTDARRDFGFIERSGERILEVWRGAALLPAYVACIEQKEEIIRRIGSSLRNFKKADPDQRHSSLSILLQADPGAGKTFLVKSLADAFDYKFMRFDITQMIHRDDLLELMDSVATAQANDPSDLIVFVDEINAQVDNAHVYGSFLLPLEEGYYVRRGSAFALRPCVWIFAGTDPERFGRPKSDKYSDFESRMTSLECLDFASLQEAYENNTDRLQDESRLEQIYLGALMIHHFFPDVVLVSKSVLKQFYKLDPTESPFRKIRKMCEKLRDVQYGKVSRRNCEEWTKARWSNEPKEFIRLIFEKDVEAKLKRRR